MNGPFYTHQGISVSGNDLNRLRLCYILHSHTHTHSHTLWLRLPLAAQHTAKHTHTHIYTHTHTHTYTYTYTYTSTHTAVAAGKRASCTVLIQQGPRNVNNLPRNVAVSSYRELQGQCRAGGPPEWQPLGLGSPPLPPCLRYPNISGSTHTYNLACPFDGMEWKA